MSDHTSATPEQKIGNETNGSQSKGDKNGTDTVKVDGLTPAHRFPPTPNPYHFPEFVLFRGLTFNGSPVFYGPVKDDPLTHVKNIRELPMRKDDIIIAAYPKCGTHWVNEISHMLTSGRTNFAENTKEFTMLEFVNDLSVLDKAPSPRLLNSHLNMVHLPEQIVDKKIKIVHIIRNPKDTIVSAYHHLKQSAKEGFTFDMCLKGFTTENYLTIGNQFSYLQQMAEFEASHPGHPIIHVHFEDLKRRAVPTIQSLAKFLDVSASESFCEQIAAACGFENMKSADNSRSMPEHLINTMPTKKKLSIYRKGIVGDWKNSFTVAQNEMFDEFIRSQPKLPYDFRDFE